MADIIVVQNRSVSYTANGQETATDESYIKISTSFRNGTLRRLQGAPLSAFIDVALHEADDPPGVTLAVISDETGISYRHLLRIMPKLCNDTYCAIAGTDSQGNQIYRVSAYAWFGKEKPLYTGAPADATAIPKKSHDILSHDNGVPVVVGTKNNSKPNSIEKTTTNTRVQNVLRECGIFGGPLLRLSSRVSEETARKWAEWVASNPKGIHNPAGVVVNALLADPDARPTIKAKKEETARRPSITGKFAPARASDEDSSNE